MSASKAYSNRRGRRKNTVVVRNPMQRQGGRGIGIRRDPYVIEMDRGRNCYSCGGFGHLA